VNTLAMFTDGRQVPSEGEGAMSLAILQAFLYIENPSTMIKGMIIYNSHAATTAI
jgi:hypothetical protein